MFLPLMSQTVDHYFNKYRKRKIADISPESFRININKNLDYATTSTDEISVESLDTTHIKASVLDMSVMPVETRLMLTMFYMLGTVINYALMCVVMTMNMNLIFSLLFGVGLAYFLFRY